MPRVLIDEKRFFAWVKKDKRALAKLDNGQSVPTLLTVRQFATKHPAFPEGGIRHRIFHSKSNGLDDFGAIVRKGAPNEKPTLWRVW